MHEFVAWPTTSRLFRDVVVTEKIDGTNSAIHISAAGDVMPEGSKSVHVDGRWYVVSTQSRKRIITPGKTTDNYGFAGWVYDHAAELVRLLGEGVHFGEWWGQGIQRRYDMQEKVFSLFNTERYEHLNHDDGAVFGGSRINTVPILYAGVFSEIAIRECLMDLKEFGSAAAPGFKNPEGICIYHTQTRGVMKVTLDNQDAGKWEAVA